MRSPLAAACTTCLFVLSPHRAWRRSGVGGMMEGWKRDGGMEGWREMVGRRDGGMEDDGGMGGMVGGTMEGGWEGWWESTSACIANRRCNLVIDNIFLVLFLSVHPPNPPTLLLVFSPPPIPHDPGVLKSTLPAPAFIALSPPTSRHPILRAQKKTHTLTFF